jgi:FtsP/CotA-like multicopper oxidase with cupredoxin domain
MGVPNDPRIRRPFERGTQMLWLRFVLVLVAASYLVAPASAQVHARAQAPGNDLCPRPAAGSAVPEPEDLRNTNGVLQVDFSYRNSPDGHGGMRYCYLYKDGSQAPNLRVHPGDWLILRLKNDFEPTPSLSRPDNGIQNQSMHHHRMAMPMPSADSCAEGTMGPWSTNLHFHGLSLPPQCHQDDVLRTYIAPGSPPFEYRFQIPAGEPPGVYWYHPHVHGFSKVQVQGGASGALIVEGIEKFNKELAGMPERVLIIRDQPLLYPDAVPADTRKTRNIPEPPVRRDHDGDILNTNTGGGKPSFDLSINFVPVPYPDYIPATIAVRPGKPQLWRVVNAAAITYLDLRIALGNGDQQLMGLVSLDGVPITEGGRAPNRILWQDHLALPPGGRVDFIYRGLPEGVRSATLLTQSVDTGPAGENDPIRPLATIVTRADEPEPHSALPAVTAPAAVAAQASTQPASPQRLPWLGDVQPVRERKLYFSERPSNPSDPNSPTVFMLTVEGQAPVPYDPRSDVPNIITHQGDVEDWVIENRTRELHAFHIHQLHFLLVDWKGVPVHDTLLRDTVNVAYWDGTSASFPSVRLRMDFRDPNIVGTFVYHCHLLEHEDGGMMGTIRVLPAPQQTTSLRKN